MDFFQSNRVFPLIIAADPATGVLVQYGAVGAVALLALAAVRVLYAKMSAALDRETQRADRLEEELRKLNETVRTEYVDTINTAAQAIAEANRAIEDARAAVRRS
ncbi:hypothetical protein [Streptomyces sp. NPDC059009]|uniref:hypothetical protein n=1 Tax=Streptomyces sp. NPDC059009 TaxID=3346694 RepID=UPI0036B6FBFF